MPFFDNFIDLLDPSGVLGKGMSVGGVPNPSIGGAASGGGSGGLSSLLTGLPGMSGGAGASGGIPGISQIPLVGGMLNSILDPFGLFGGGGGGSYGTPPALDSNWSGGGTVWTNPNNPVPSVPNPTVTGTGQADTASETLSSGGPLGSLLTGLPGATSGTASSGASAGAGGLGSLLGGGGSGSGLGSALGNSGLGIDGILGGSGTPGTAGGAGGVIGGLTGSEAVYGTKPLPVHIPSPSELLQQQGAANLGAVPNILKLTDLLGKGEQQTALAQLEAADPGAAAARAKQMENLQAGLAGVVPQSTADATARRAAAKNITAGTTGQIGDFRDLRNFGIDALAAQQNAGRDLNSLASNLKSTVMPSLYDSNRGLLTAQYDPYAEFQNLLHNANVNAAPVPAAAGSAAAQQAMLEAILSIYSGTPHSGAANYTNPFAGGGGSVPTPVSPFSSTSGNSQSGSTSWDATQSGYRMMPDGSVSWVEGVSQ